MHLWFPLLSSFLYVLTLFASQAANRRGVGPLAVTLASNVALAIAFAPFWWLGGPTPPVSQWWVPVLVAAFCNGGMALTYAAVSVGDVSVAAPVFGMKVVFVTIILSVVDRPPPPAVWAAAVLATAGVVVIQWTGAADRRRTLMTVAIALAAAASYAAFDTSLQMFARRWPPGRLLPMTYACVLAMTIPLAWFVDRSKLGWSAGGRYVAAAAVLFVIQAMGIAGVIVLVGDAAGVNVVYSLRGLWGVALAYGLSRRIGGAEANLTRGQFAQRLVGASMLSIAVALVVWVR